MGTALAFAVVLLVLYVRAAHANHRLAIEAWERLHAMEEVEAKRSQAEADKRWQAHVEERIARHAATRQAMLDICKD